MTKRPYKRSGFYSTALVPAPDSPVAEALRERRAALVADLGGPDEVTEAQGMMLDLIVAAWWKLDSVTSYLLSLPSLVDRRHRKVWQVVKDRAALAAQLQSLLRDIGLERRAKKVLDLDEYLREKVAQKAEAVPPPPAITPPAPHAREAGADQTAFDAYMQARKARGG
jgi:hypothetical protein